MLFSSLVFLCLFFPLCFYTYFITVKKYRNIVLLIASLIFYAWGEPRFVFLMLFSIFINWYFGLIIYNENIKKARILKLKICIIANLVLLGYFKYYNFFIDNINLIFSSNIDSKSIILPIGISFYTFQALSYVIDVYRSKEESGELKAQKNFFDLALYVSLFPQLIAGPIVKYHDVEKQITNRESSIQDLYYGMKRFIYGLTKKIIISNTLASIADEIFSININDLGTTIAWLGILCYTLQIYYDFSGYSDMAIGLGRIFGFRFLENFNYPYIATSIQDFWRRWHISLSTWFREYLYIPLGGNRKGEIITYRNLILVFFATGLWHGASWNFIVWGLFHGIFIVMERYFLGGILKNNKYRILNHVYVTLVFMLGWVFFRSDNLLYAYKYINVLFFYNHSPIYDPRFFVDIFSACILCVGILFSGPIQIAIPQIKNMAFEENNVRYTEVLVLIMFLLICIINLVSGAYNPFIYFRF